MAKPFTWDALDDLIDDLREQQEGGAYGPPEMSWQQMRAAITAWADARERDAFEESIDREGREQVDREAGEPADGPRRFGGMCPAMVRVAPEDRKVSLTLRCCRVEGHDGEHSWRGDVPFEIAWYKTLPLDESREHERPMLGSSACPSDGLPEPRPAPSPEDPTTPT